MKCPDCGTTKIDIEPENQQRGIVIRVYCTQCDYTASGFMEEDEIEREETA
jgi:hypothetical protein